MMHAKKFNNFQSIFSPDDFENNFDAINFELKNKGIVFLKNIFSNQIAKNVADKFGLIVENIDADKIGIAEISNQRKGNNKKNSAAFTTLGLNLHTDRSPIENPPSLIMNWMCVKDCVGGQSILVDSYKVYEKIKKENNKVIDILSHPDVACFTDGIDTFTSPIFKFDHNNRLLVRFRYDQCSYFKLEAKEAVSIFQKTAESLSQVIDFEIGAGYIINNWRWLHGRNPFKGYRMVKRIHIMGEKG